MKKASEVLQAAIEAVQFKHDIYSKEEVLDALRGVKMEVLQNEEQEPDSTFDKNRIADMVEEMKERVGRSIKDFDYDNEIDLDMRGREIDVTFNGESNLIDEVESDIQDVAENHFPETYGLEVRK